MRHPRSNQEGGGAHHDSGYKHLFSHPRTVKALCRGFLPAAWVKCLDLSTLERAPGSFSTGNFQERHSDIVWRVRLRGEPRHLYLLLEFQSTPDPLMPLRTMTYASLLLQIVALEPGVSPAGLPWVIPVVIYSGQSPWRTPLDAADLFAPPPPALADLVLPRFRYLLLDEKELALDAPELADNLVAAVFRIETCKEPDQLRRLFQALLDLAAREKGTALRSLITEWLRHKLKRVFSDPIRSIIVADLEDVAMLEESIIRWEQEFVQKGRREGLQEGRVEGMRQMLLKQIEARFGPLPAKARRSLKAVKMTEELERLGRELLTAASLQDLGLVG